MDLRKLNLFINIITFLYSKSLLDFKVMFIEIRFIEWEMHNITYNTLIYNSNINLIFNLLTLSNFCKGDAPSANKGLLIKVFVSPLGFADFIRYWEIQLNSRRERCNWKGPSKQIIILDFYVSDAIACDLKIIENHGQGHLKPFPFPFHFTPWIYVCFSIKQSLIVIPSSGMTHQMPYKSQSVTNYIFFYTAYFYQFWGEVRSNIFDDKCTTNWFFLPFLIPPKNKRRWKRNRCSKTYFQQDFLYTKISLSRKPWLKILNHFC